MLNVLFSRPNHLDRMGYMLCNSDCQGNEVLGEVAPPKTASYRGLVDQNVTNPHSRRVCSCGHRALSVLRRCPNIDLVVVDIGSGVLRLHGDVREKRNNVVRFDLPVSSRKRRIKIPLRASCTSTLARKAVQQQLRNILIR